MELIKKELDLLQEPNNLIVLPLSHRSKVVVLAHDRSGHLGWEKVLPMIRRNFAWPLMSKLVKDYCSSCQPCQRKERSGPRREPMVTRAIRNVPFEEVAIDLVGPL